MGTLAEAPSMSYANHKTKAIKLADVCFYFDAVERDSMDAFGQSRRSGELLALRERLLKLPEAEFDAAIKTLRGMVDDKKTAALTQDPERRRSVQTLYDEARPSRSGGSSPSTKVSPT